MKVSLSRVQIFVSLPGSSEGYSPWGHNELDTTEWLSFFLLVPSGLQ